MQRRKDIGNMIRLKTYNGMQIKVLLNDIESKKI